MRIVAAMRVLSGGALVILGVFLAGRALLLNLDLDIPSSFSNRGYRVAMTSAVVIALCENRTMIL